ncbi:pyrimidine nucleotide-sugar transmembrane transporter [Fragilaria crotonensis]|nr:pyrimidine nucleotide-sugar transmembrane transporter [Fragilaria crotonensis]
MRTGNPTSHRRSPRGQRVKPIGMLQLTIGNDISVRPHPALAASKFQVLQWISALSPDPKPQSQLTNFLTTPPYPIVGPVSLIGGTAAIYSSLLRHPSSTLTPLSMMFLMLLALQYALQPRLSKRFIPPLADKQKVALVEEIVKTGMAAVLFFSKPQSAVQSALADWSLSSSLAVAGLPAALYALQGVLQYTSHQHLDPVTFNGLSQTKTLSAALCCWLVLGSVQSPLQMVALVVLMAAALIFQGYYPKQRGNTAESAATTSPSSSASSIPSDSWWILGVGPCLGAAMLSGLAGALSQKGLQLTGIRGRDPFLYTMEISTYSAIVLVANMWFNLPHNSNAKDDKQKGVASASIPWKMALIPIMFKAAGGVVTALVHKYAGSVAKGFALLFGLVLSGGLQLLLQNEELQPNQIVGTLLIMLSTHLHFTHPAMQR